MLLPPPAALQRARAPLPLLAALAVAPLPQRAPRALALAVPVRLPWAQQQPALQQTPLPPALAGALLARLPRRSLEQPALQKTPRARASRCQA
jgi:hypothetical protein